MSDDKEDDLEELESEVAAEAEAGGEEDDPWASAMAEQDVADQAAGVGAARAELEELQDLSKSDAGDGGSPNLDVILDIPVTLAMEVGNTNVTIRNLLQLNQGSVIELDRLAGEPLDVLVNGTLIAHGEVVVVNEKFGVRLTDVVSPAERIKRLA